MSIDFFTLQSLTIPVMIKRVKLTNLVPAMSSLSFEVRSSSGACEMSTSHSKYGSTALCNIGVSGYNEMYSMTTMNFKLIPDHFYYACVEVYQETKLGSIDYFWPSGSPSMFGGKAPGDADTWKKCSNVTTRSTFAAGEYPVRLDFNNGGTAGKIWYDGLMLIDLTEAFGAGNEPGTAWCEANIPYFTGTTTMDIPLSSPVQASVTEIKDASGMVIWAVNSEPDVPIVLEVEQKYYDNYVGGNTYQEMFILLDIYPKKSNSVVNVTYGGLTKTLTFSGLDAQQVYFGVFGGVSDGVTLPNSGTLTIEGGCIGVGNGTYNASKSKVATTISIQAITDWGGIKIIPDGAFDSAEEMTNAIIPEGVPSIGNSAFSSCSKLASVTIPASVTSIGNYAFRGCTKLNDVNIPESVTSIGSSAFSSCIEFTNVYIPASVMSIGIYAFYQVDITRESVEFENVSGWYVTQTEGGDASTGVAVDVSNPTNNVILIQETYADYYWYRS